MKIKNYYIALLIVFLIVFSFIILIEKPFRPNFYDADGNKIENITILSGIELNKSLEKNSQPLEDCYDEVYSEEQTELEYWKGMCNCLGENLCLNYTYFEIEKKMFTEQWAEMSCQKIKKNVFDCQGQVVKI